MLLTEVEDVMGVAEVSKLAHTRGCVLNIMLLDEGPFYWIENSFFISKPFECLDELVHFIHAVPHLFHPETQPSLKLA
jgi:hypothetical protein